MSSPFFGLDIALTGLFTSQIQLNTTTHNISNAETEGYTRQNVATKASDAMRTNSKIGMVGTGVVATDISQVRNEYYDIKYRRSNGIYGEYESRAYYLHEIENYLNELDKTGFTTIYDNFYNSLIEVSNDPTDFDKRQLVMQEGETLLNYFNTLYTNLQIVQSDLNSAVGSQVKEINSLASQISELTVQINTYEIGGGVANDLRDQRNALVDRLSNICDVEVEERDVHKEEGNVGSKSYTVKINGEVLVETNMVNKLRCVVREPKENQNDVDGLYDVRWVNTGEKLSMSTNHASGSLKALLDVRDGNNCENLNGLVNTKEGKKTAVMYSTNINEISKMNMPEQGVLNVGGKRYEYDGFNVVKRADGTFEYTFNLTSPAAKTEYGANAAVGSTVDCKGVTYFMSQINEFVRTFSSEFNEIHKSGEDYEGNINGLDFFVYTSGLTGQVKEDIPDIYRVEGTQVISSKDVSYYNMLGNNIKVNDILMKNPKMLSTAEPKYEGDDKIDDGVNNTGVIEKLIALKSDVNMFRQGSPAAFLQSIVSEIGVVTSNSQILSDNQKNIVESIEEMKMSVSGVDLDEEGMDLIKFQRAYELSSKVFNVMNEIYQKLINETGV